MQMISFELFYLICPIIQAHTGVGVNLLPMPVLDTFINFVVRLYLQNHPADVWRVSQNTPYISFSLFNKYKAILPTFLFTFTQSILRQK